MSAGTEQPVLVARLDNVGDVLLAGPAIRAVACQHPVVAVAGPDGREAARLLPGVAEVIELAAPWVPVEPGPVDGGELAHFITTVIGLRPRAAAILTSSHQSPLPLALLLRLAGVPEIAGVSVDHAGSLLDHRIPGDPDLHEVERALAVVGQLGYRLAEGDDGRLAVRLSSARQAATPGDDGDRAAGNGAATRHTVIRHDGVAPAIDGDGRLPGDAAGPAANALAGVAGTDLFPHVQDLPEPPYVVVHPGASAPARTLPPARWRKAVAALGAAGRRVVVTGSAAESSLTALVAAGWPDTVDLGGRTTLQGLAGVLNRAEAVVCGNSGPVHLAAAVGTPVVVAFPPTVPLRRWRPWMVPHEVLGNQAVPCQGCRRGACPIAGQPCLAGVGDEDVVAAVDRLAPPGRLPAAPGSEPGSAAPPPPGPPGEDPAPSPASPPVTFGPLVAKEV